MINGHEMYNLASKLFPICRSITGNGVRETLSILREEYFDMQIYEVPAGTKVFDWTIPKEWSIKDGFISTECGEKIIDFKDNNLHIVGYSTPIDKIVDLKELQKYIYSLPEQPEWIPYVTSYYKERFGFCMSNNQRMSLSEGKYRMYINSELSEGSLTYGEILIKGDSEQEIFLSTYVCHPSMANNELSGPVVAINLAKYISSLSNRRYSYRIVFIPETIGSITYINKNLDELKKNVIAGYNISCVGDDRAYSYIQSRYGKTLADRAAKYVLKEKHPEYKTYSYLDRGSDERQYCSPGVDLPLCAICRTKYGEYPEYHTSADNMSLISPEGLFGAFDVYRDCIDLLENNIVYKATCLCEPQLGVRGLYPTESYKGSAKTVKTMMDFLAYADGTNDLIEIGNIIRVPVAELLEIVKKLLQSGLIKAC